MYYCCGKGGSSVLCREVVPFSEGPLSEAPLYVHSKNDQHNLYLHVRKKGSEVRMNNHKNFEQQTIIISL